MFILFLLAKLTVMLMLMCCTRHCEARWLATFKESTICLKGRKLRGGGSDVNHENGENVSSMDESALRGVASQCPTRSSPSSSSKITKTKASVKRRRASDLIHDLIERSGLDQEEVNTFTSVELRRLILQRKQDQISEIQQVLTMSDTSEADSAKLPDPRRLLHYLAPKIPAIKHSPDAALRIQSANSDLDPGLAACVIGSVAHVCVLRDKALTYLRETDSALAGRDSSKAKHRKSRGDKDESMSLQIVKERRFEQLLECLLCGVNVQMRMKEYSQRQIDHDADAESIEEILHEKQAQITEGLYVRDAARAAWGLAILGAHRVERLGGELVTDFLVALSLRMRELLLARLQELREGDLSSQTRDVEGRIFELSEELAEDAASAMWAFACVRALTGLKFAPLFEICCMVLCQNPVEMRKRAQETEKDLDALNVGSSDVVERLAKSEGELSRHAGVEDDASQADSTTIKRATLIDFPPAEKATEDRDTLLDFLSPNEVTDVLWALALHGSRSHEESSREEIALSETAATFREIACDRLVWWLQAELEHIRSTKARLGDSDMHQIREEVMTINIVDAASILRSEHAAAESGGSTAVTENMTVGDDSAENGLQHVQVIDAAQVLALESNGESAGDVQRLNLLDKSSLDKETMYSRPAVVSTSSILKMFHLHDLCSIAWAVTELHDSLQPSVTQIVIDIFYELGAGTLHELEGRDLSNLAWAVAKSSRAAGSPEAADSSFLLMTWIADVLAPPEGAEFDGRSSLLLRLQPPELGRLVWAIATCYSSLETPDYYQRDSIRCLALNALDVAMDNFSNFGSEDLARIVWGFMVLSDPETVVNVPRASKALGMALATIKASLLDWENGTLPSKNEESFSSKYPFTFTSFFGKARFLAQLLDQQDESTEEFDDFGLSLLTRKSRLPLLKDLPLDPSTLCKITLAFVKLHIECPFITGGEVFSRVALRLMTSRSGRLLRECPLSDLVRLCEAIASESVPLGRERVGLFVRKLVQLFNTDWFADDSHTLTSHEKATLIWSLGELGVKHTLNAGDDVLSAHRRLQIIGRLPVLNGIHVRSLSTSVAIKLISGLVSTHLALSQTAFAVKVLDVLCERMENLDSVQLCRLAEVVSRFKRLTMDETEWSPVDSSLTLEMNNGSKVEQVSDTGQLCNFTNENSDSRGSTGCADVIAACDKVLSVLAKSATERTNTFTAEELRRLASVYSLCPFRADELVAAVSREVDTRLELLESRPFAEVGMESRLQSLGLQSELLLKSLNVDESESLGATIRNGLSSLFRGERKEPEQEGSDPGDFETSNLDQIQETLSSMIALSRDFSELSRLASFDEVLRFKAQSATFELGRCKELVAHYKRIDFVSGRRENRYVREDRRTLAKQVLSRLLP